MKKYKWAVIFLNLVLILLFFNLSLAKKEKILSGGELILLELAPVDPRSLMQGDYMQLNYSISQMQIFDYINENYARRGYCVVRVDENGVASGIRLQAEKTPLAPGEKLIEYTAGSWGRISIGAESFFFQEGQGEKFAKARYGGIKVDRAGNSVLIGLYDENRKQIK